MTERLPNGRLRINDPAYAVAPLLSFYEATVYLGMDNRDTRTVLRALNEDRYALISRKKLDYYIEHPHMVWAKRSMRRQPA